MQPEFISHLRAGELLNYENQIAIAQYFSQHRQIHGNVLKAMGDDKSASIEYDKTRTLERAVENSKKQLRIKR